MFKPNRQFERQLLTSSDARRFVADVADDVATAIEVRLPYPNILGGLTVSSRTVLTASGWEGEARVQGPGWALWEFGTINHGARPAIRPGAQAALSLRGGRLGESR